MIEYSNRNFKMIKLVARSTKAYSNLKRMHKVSAMRTGSAPTSIQRMREGRDDRA